MRAVRGSRCGARETYRGGQPSARVSAFHVAAATAAKTASDALARGGALSGSSVTRTGGMSRARMMPNDRMVRSCTSPVSGSTAIDSVSTQPSAMCTAPIAYDRSTTSSSGSPAAKSTSTPARAPVSASISTRALATAPLGVTTGTSRPSAPAVSTACSAKPAARSSVPTGGPATSASVHVARTRTPSTVGQTFVVPPRATTPSISTTPSRTTAVALIGARFGPQRTTSSRANTTRTGLPY